MKITVIVECMERRVKKSFHITENGFKIQFGHFKTHTLRTDARHIIFTRKNLQGVSKLLKHRTDILQLVSEVIALSITNLISKDVQV